MKFSKDKIQWLVLIICITFAMGIQYNYDWEKEKDPHPERDLFFIPESRYVKLLSAGFSEFVADIYWIKTVVYFGKNTTSSDLPIAISKFTDEDYDPVELDRIKKDNQVRFSYLYDLLDMITDLDPYFNRPYFFGGLHLSLKIDDADNSIKLLKKGMKYNPEDWSIPYLLGFNYYFYKNDPETAIKYLREVLLIPGCPDLPIAFTEGILREHKKRDAAIGFVEGIRKNTKDDKVRKTMENILEELKKSS